MPPLYAQRAELLVANTALILRWLAVAAPETRANIIEGLVRKYSLPDLRLMHAHLAEQVARAEQVGAP